MADFTKRAIKETFIALLEEHPISEITVKRIVDTCGVNRNSFYYHYQDLPALVEEIVKEESEEIMQKYPTIGSIVEYYDALIEFASHRKRPIMHIFRSLNREVFENYLMNVCEYFVTSYINSTLSYLNLEEEKKKALTDYYKCLGFGLIIDWLNHNMQEEYALRIRKICLAKQNILEEMAELLKEEV